MARSLSEDTNLFYETVWGLNNNGIPKPMTSRMSSEPQSPIIPSKDDQKESSSDDDSASERFKVVGFKISTVGDLKPSLLAKEICKFNLSLLLAEEGSMIGELPSERPLSSENYSPYERGTVTIIDETLHPEHCDALLSTKEPSPETLKVIKQELDRWEEFRPTCTLPAPVNITLDYSHA
jgi:hypothetical protein